MDNAQTPVDGVQLVVGPVRDDSGNYKLILGFHNAFFSQSVYLPYTNKEDMEALIAGLASGIREAASMIEGARNAVPDKETGIILGRG